MRITGFESYFTILAELGNRVKALRLASNLSQKDFSEKCGVSIGTLKRIESGEDFSVINLMRIMYGLNLTSNFEMLIPESQLDYQKIYEKKPDRKRASAKQIVPKSKWVWGEDKEKEKYNS